MSFTLPTVGEQFTPQYNDLPSGVDPARGDAAVNEALQRDARHIAYTGNLRLKEQYAGKDPVEIDEVGSPIGTFPAWHEKSYRTGTLMGPAGKGDPDILPPPIPAGYMAVVIENEGGGIVYDQQQVGPPVCQLEITPEAFILDGKVYKKLPHPQH